MARIPGGPGGGGTDEQKTGGDDSSSGSGGAGGDGSRPTGIAGPEDTPGGGGGGGGGGRSRAPRDGSRPTGPAGPEDTPGGGGGGGGGSRDRRSRGGRDGSRPTGIAGPEETPSSGGRGGSGGRDGSRPTGPAGPSDTPGSGGDSVTRARPGVIQAVESDPGRSDSGGETRRQGVLEGVFGPDVVARERRDLGDTPLPSLTPWDRTDRLEEDFRNVQAATDRAARDIQEGPVGIGAGLLAERLYPDSALGQDITERAVTGPASAAARLPSAPVDTAAGTKEAVETGAFVLGAEGSDELAERLDTAGEQTGRFFDDVLTSGRDRPVEFLAGAAFETAIGGAGVSAVRRGASRTPDAPEGFSSGLTSRVSRSESAFDLPDFRSDTRGMAGSSGRYRQRGGSDSGGSSTSISGEDISRPSVGRDQANLGLGRPSRGPSDIMTEQRAGGGVGPSGGSGGGLGYRSATTERTGGDLPTPERATDPLEPTLRTPQGDVLADPFATGAEAGGVLSTGAVDLSLPTGAELSQTGVGTTRDVNLAEDLRTDAIGRLGERGETDQPPRGDVRTRTGQRTDTLLRLDTPQIQTPRTDADQESDPRRPPRIGTDPDRPRRLELGIEGDLGDRKRKRAPLLGREQRFRYETRDLL